MSKLPDIDVKKTYELPPLNTWRASHHLFDEESVLAIRASMVANRPLLVRGEPGTGKSQLARAAAVALGRQFLPHVVTAHSEIQDLWYHFDAVNRLADAQVARTAQDAVDLSPEKYLSAGVFWWAFDPASAKQQADKTKHHAFQPTSTKPEDYKNGVVLLIDEIDKADSDLPNSLLETLDNGRFSVPWQAQPVGVQKGMPAPLVIITTNEDRQLPGAFVRRCLVLNMALPEEQEQQAKMLKQRAHAHFSGQLAGKDMVLDSVAAQLWSDRKTARQQGVTPPGQAEFLDILHILFEMEQDTQKQLELLDKIGKFALKKFPEMKR